MKKFLKLKTLIPVLFIIGVLILVNFTDFSKTIKGFFYSFSAPLNSFFWTAGNTISDFGGGLFNIQNLKKENELLKGKNKELLADIFLLKEVKNENELLKNSMGLEINKEFDLIFADIVGKDIFRDSILINKGSKDGVRKNQPVLTSQKTLLGRIGEVYENFSEIVLISSPDVSFDAKVSETDISGVLKGNGHSEISLQFVSKEKELKIGNFVVSTALGGIFPEGILIGEIQEIKKSDTDPFQSAKIKPSFDIKSLDKLFIVKNFRSLK